MAKKFFYVCAGILMLAGAFALGARTVEAQVGDHAISGVTNVYHQGQERLVAISEAGDVYVSDSNAVYWEFTENIFLGPIGSETESMGDVKSMFR